MSDRKLLKQAIIATLCGHERAAYYQEKVFYQKNLKALAEQLEASGDNICKEDFFRKDERERYFLDSAAAWRNFDNILNIVHSMGERFEADDFLRTLDGTRSFLDSALIHGGFDKIFQEKVWGARFEEMEDLYYHIPAGKRRQYDNGHKLAQLKRQMYEKRGETLREDILAKMSIDWQDFPAMFGQSGGIEKLRHFVVRMERNGEGLTRKDVLFCDYDGDTMLSHHEAWSHFTEIQKMLSHSGETLKVEDFLLKRGRKPSVLQRACEAKALDKVFDPQFWVDRPQDMIDLWQHLKPLEQAQLGHERFDRLLNDVESQTYGSVLNQDSLLTREDLLQPIAIEGNVKIRPLGLTVVWDNLADISKRLKENGQNIQMTDLRETSGFKNVTIFETALKNGHFDKIVDIAKASGEGLAVEDLLTKDSAQKTMLENLTDRQELNLLFDPDLWAGRVDSMKVLWAQIPIEHKSQVDWKTVLSRSNAKTLQNARKPGKGKRVIRRRKKQ